MAARRASSGSVSTKVSHASQELPNLNSFTTHTYHSDADTAYSLATFNKLYGLLPLAQRLFVHRRVQRGAKDNL